MLQHLFVLLMDGFVFQMETSHIKVLGIIHPHFIPNKHMYYCSRNRPAAEEEEEEGLPTMHLAHFETVAKGK